MDLIDAGAIIVAIIAAIGAWASQRASAKAFKINTIVSKRLEAEQGAYERARTFDIQTIERQDAEIAELQESNALLRKDNEILKRDNTQLKSELTNLYSRVARLEGPSHPDWERRIQD